MLVSTAIITSGEKPVRAIPSAVPLAGGCSKSKATIRQIEIPTAVESTKAVVNVDVWGIRAQTEPESIPTIWPPITLLGMAVIFLGMVKTMNAVAPMEAITTAFCSESTKSIKKITSVARKLWYR